MNKPTDTQTKPILNKLSRTQTKLAIAASVAMMLGFLGSATLWTFNSIVQAADERYILKTGSLTRSLATVQDNQKSFKLDSLNRDLRYFNDKIWDLEGYMEKSPNTVTSRERLRLKELEADRDGLKREIDRLKRQ